MIGIAAIGRDGVQIETLHVHERAKKAGLQHLDVKAGDAAAGKAAGHAARGHFAPHGSGCGQRDTARSGLE